MNKELLELEKELVQKKEVPVFWPGDEISVHVRIQEGDKERVQVFTGTCIARIGTGLRETFTVRKEAYGEGVERIFPVHSPIIKKIDVLKTRKAGGIAARAKLYYLRDKSKKR